MVPKTKLYAYIYVYIYIYHSPNCDFTFSDSTYLMSASKTRVLPCSMVILQKSSLLGAHEYSPVSSSPVGTCKVAVCLSLNLADLPSALSDLPDSAQMIAFFFNDPEPNLHRVWIPRNQQIILGKQHMFLGPALGVPRGSAGMEKSVSWRARGSKCFAQLVNIPKKQVGFMAYIYIYYIYIYMYNIIYIYV